MSRHRLTVSLVGRREGTGLLTSLPSLCFGPSVHASGRQGQGPARFLVPLVNRGPVARRASSVGTAHSVHSPAPGGGRNDRSEERSYRHSSVPSRPFAVPAGITALRRPCRRNRAKEVTAFHSFPPSLRSGVSLPFPFIPSTPLTHLSPPLRRRNGGWKDGEWWGRGRVRGVTESGEQEHGNHLRTVNAWSG